MSRLANCNKTTTKKTTQFNVPEICVEDCEEDQENSKLSQQSPSPTNQSSPSRKGLVPLNSSADLMNFYFTYDYQNGTGELYMRVGTAIFSICALISRCLTLVQMLENYFNNHAAIVECKLTFTVAIVTKIFCILFIFLQSFFIFKFANIVIHYGKNTALIGLMHIVSTNFCLFIRTVVAETVSEISEIRHAISHDHMSLSSNHQQGGYSNMSNVHGHHRRAISEREISPLSTVHFDTQTPLKLRHLGCISTGAFTTNISLGIQEAQDKISAYLYPCIIEYSLMSMTVFYILWASIKSRYNINTRHGGGHELNESKRGSVAHLKMNSLDVSGEKTAFQRINTLMHEKQQINKFTIDCGKSTTGLFFGMLVLLLTVNLVHFRSEYLIWEKMLSLKYCDI